MLMRFKLPWDVREKITPDRYQSLCLVADMPPLQEDGSLPSLYGEFQGDIVKVIEIVGRVEVSGEVHLSFFNTLQTLATRIEEIRHRQDNCEMFNMKCNVHVPGLGLLLLDEIMLVDDACTDEIQDHLNNRWRIIAVCPQPNQRRPDYVLGRQRKLSEA